MLFLVRSIPDQLCDGWKLARAALARIQPGPPPSILLCGMGGSGISGDLLRGLLLYTSPVSIEVLKDYTLPGWIDEHCFAVVISYSGDTEETLDLWNALEKRGVSRMAVASGGKLKELALSKKVPLVEVPQGYPPRAAVGYLFAALLHLVSHWGIYPDAEEELSKAVALIRSRMPDWEKETRALAGSLKESFPIVHSLDVRFAPLGYRLVCQLNENAKMLAHTHFYPEMNHNEIVGFEGRTDEKIVLVMLDPGQELTHPRNRMRREIVSRILPSSLRRFTISAEGESLFSRFFSLLVKADLLSVFLAEARGVDPLPVSSIERLKKELG